MTMDPPRIPSCPRCNYDLSGSINAWTDSCPLAGTCSECGLPFHWHDIFNADRLIIPGFVEHARGLLRTLVWAWVTWAWTLWPAIFWRKVRIEHRPRMWHCMLWLAILILPVHAIVATARTIAVCRDYLDWTASQRRPAVARGGGGPIPAFHPAIRSFPCANALSPWGEPLVRLDSGSWWAIGRHAVPWTVPASVDLYVTKWPRFIPALAAVSVTVPVVLLVLPVTRRRAKVCAPLVLRSAIYGCSWIVVPALAWELWMVAYVAFQLSSPTGWATGRMTHWYSGVLPGWGDVLSWPYRSLFEHPLAWFVACMAWCNLWWRRAILTLFQGHSPRSVMAAAFIAAAISALIPLMSVREFLEWLVNLPGVEYLFPPNHQ